MKALLVVLLFSAMAHAGNDTWSVNGQTFYTKAAVLRYLAHSKRGLTVIHSRCELLSNNFTLKACPKNGGSLGNQPYDPSVTPDELNEGGK